MMRSLKDFVCSRVSRHAATLQPQARASYFRWLVIAYCIWVGLASLLAALSVALAVYSITSKAGFGYTVLFVVGCLAFVALARCFFSLFRYASREFKAVA
jgi:hypothetical protein